MRKVLYANIAQETCSFNNQPTTIEKFVNNYYYDAEALAIQLPTSGVTGGFISIMKQQKCFLKGIIDAKSSNGGALSSDTYLTLKEKLLNGIHQDKDTDTIFISLHGAMEAEGEFDTEGDILAEVRSIVGQNCLIVAGLDHHANVTQKMFENSDIIVGHEEQPHSLFNTGKKSAEVMLNIWDYQGKIESHLCKIPMLAPQDRFWTSHGPMKEWFDLAREMEKDPEVFTASTFPTQPWLDVPDNGWSCVIYAATKAKAKSYAEQLADKVWELRNQFWRSERLSVSDTIKKANEAPEGLVVISDTGDAFFGGAPGDNMTLAAEMLKVKLNGPALVPVIDTEAFKIAKQAGIGAELELQIGGKNSSEFFPKQIFTGKVKAISPAQKVNFSTWNIGYNACETILFECGELKIAILQRPNYIINHPALYENLGIDVSKSQMAVLKTGSNFFEFDNYQSCLLRADTKGSTQSDLTELNWKNLTRPMYPFDDIKDWRTNND